MVPESCGGSGAGEGDELTGTQAQGRGQGGGGGERAGGARGHDGGELGNEDVQTEQVREDQE